jgi:nucleotide-binding universal stress UspA family protein
VFSNILLPTDGSAVSLKGVKAGLKLAREQKARATALYVCAPWEPTAVYPDAAFVSEVEHALMEKKRSDRGLDAVKKAATAAGVRCTRLRAIGSEPGVEIAKAARKNRCDLICIASHGRRGIARLLLGSQTAKVLAFARIPVLVVK